MWTTWRKGHLLALERGRIGERYILGGENLSLRGAAGAGGRRRPGGGAPRVAAARTACCGRWRWPCEALARLAEIEPLVTREHLAMARKKMFFSSAKAKAELGYAPRPAREAVVDAVAWFRANRRACAA